MKWRHEHETGKDFIGGAQRLELLTKYYWDDEMKQDGMSGACSMYDEDRNAKGVW